MADEVIYNVSASSSSHIELDSEESLAAGEKLNSSTHAGKIVTRILPRGRRFGSPSGTVYGRVWSSSGSIKATIGSYSVGSWSTSDGNQPELVNTSNTVTLAVGDIVGIEYAGGDSGEGIELQQNDADVDGNWSPTNLEGSWGNSDINVNDEIAMQITTSTGGGGGGTPDNEIRMDFQAQSYAGAGVYVPSGSSLIGKVITKAVFRLQRTGNPGGTVSCIIRKSGTSILLGTKVSNDISTSGENVEFTATGNTYALVSGNYITVEPSAGSVDNYITAFWTTPSATSVAYAVVKYDQLEVYPFTPVVQFSWGTKPTHDVLATLYSGGTSTPQIDPYINMNNSPIRQVGEKVLLTTSPLYNKKITKFIPKLMAVGSPTGTIFCKVRTSTGQVVGTLGQIDASSVSPAEFTDKDFQNLLQPRFLQVDDMITLEHAEATTANYIRVATNPQSTLTRDKLVTFSGSTYTTSEMDMAAKAYVGGIASDPAARERVGEKAKTDTSILKLTKPSRVSVWLRKIGTPTGSIFCRLRDGVTDSNKATIGEILASGITTNTAGEQYEFITTPVSVATMNENDNLMIEFADGDDTNYIECLVTSTDQKDSTDSHMVRYDALWTNYDQDTTKDLIATIDQGGDTFTPTGDEIPPPPPPAYSHDLFIFAGGYPFGYTDTSENWISTIAPDIRWYRKILTVQELVNIYTNRRDRGNISLGQVAVIGFFSLAPFG